MPHDDLIKWDMVPNLLRHGFTILLHDRGLTIRWHNDYTSDHGCDAVMVAEALSVLTPHGTALARVASRAKAVQIVS